MDVVSRPFSPESRSRGRCASASLYTGDGGCRVILYNVRPLTLRDTDADSCPPLERLLSISRPSRDDCVPPGSACRSLHRELFVNYRGWCRAMKTAPHSMISSVPGDHYDGDYRAEVARRMEANRARALPLAWRRRFSTSPCVSGRGRAPPSGSNHSCPSDALRGGRRRRGDGRFLASASVRRRTSQASFRTNRYRRSSIFLFTGQGLCRLHLVPPPPPPLRTIP